MLRHKIKHPQAGNLQIFLGTLFLEDSKSLPWILTKYFLYNVTKSHDFQNSHFLLFPTMTKNLQLLMSKERETERYK